MGLTRWLLVFLVGLLASSFLFGLVGSEDALTVESWKYMEYPTETFVIVKQDYFGAFLEWSFTPVEGQAGDKRVWNFTWCLKDFVEVPVNETFFETVENPIFQVKMFLGNETKIREVYERLNVSGIEGFDNFGDFLSDVRRLDRYPVSILPEQRRFFVKEPVAFIDILNNKSGSFTFELKEWRHRIRIKIGFKSTITYSASTNTITVTGGTEVAPVTFDDLYQADLNGELELMANTTAGLNLNLTTQVRPADSKALRLKLVVTGFVSSGHVNITGTDIDGNAQTETFIQITGDGNYTTSKWFSSIDTSGVDCSGSYGIAIYQERWGVVWQWKDAYYDMAYRFDALIQIGDGVTETWFADNKKLVLFPREPFAFAHKPIVVKANANFRLGTLLDIAKKATKDGCTILAMGLTDIVITGETGSNVNIYSSRIKAPVYGQGIELKQTSGGRVWNSHVDRVWGTTAAQNLDIYRVVADAGEIVFQYTGGVIEDVLIINTESGTYAIYFPYDFGALTLKNIKLRNTLGYSVRLHQITKDHNLVNPDFDVWSLYWTGTSTAKLNRQYEFSINVTDKSGNPIENANVTISYYGQSGGTVGSWLTYANGSIPTQTLTMGFYNQTGGNTLYDYNPYNITITHPDYQTKTFNFTLDKKTEWTITLEPTATADDTYVWYTLSLTWIPAVLALAIVLKRRVKRRVSLEPPILQVATRLTRSLWRNPWRNL